jgi:hypothetical protein
MLGTAAVVGISPASLQGADGFAAGGAAIGPRSSGGSALRLRTGPTVDGAAGTSGAAAVAAARRSVATTATEGKPGGLVGVAPSIAAAGTGGAARPRESSRQ